MSALELRHERDDRRAEAEIRQEPRLEDLERERRREEEMSSLREVLLGEIREQGLLMETAARFSPRAAAETEAPRPARTSASPRSRCERADHLLEPCRPSAAAVASAVATLEALPVPGEVLILDDASRDGSREVAQELARADERIRVIASDENLGLPRARNVLLSQARFEHAMILDSDNQLVPSGVATLYASARANRGSAGLRKYPQGRSIRLGNGRDEQRTRDREVC